jgi:putative ABC transport system permease protein
MIKLAMSTLRFRAVAFLAVFVAVLMGSSIVAACGGLMESGLRLDAEPQRLAAAPLVVTGTQDYHPPNGSGSVAFPERHGVDGHLVSRLEETDGVARAVPDVSFPAVVAPGNSEVLAGHDWTSAALAPYELTSGHPPGAGEVVLDTRSAASAGVRPGDLVDLVVRGQPATVTVSGTAAAPHPIDAPALFFSGHDVQKYVPEQNSVNAIGIFPADGVSTDELAGRLDLPAGVSVLSGDDRGAAEFVGISASRLPLILVSAIFGGMAAVVMAIVVATTIGLSVRQRRRELAVLRTTGATPDQVRRMVVIETMAVSVAGGLGGLALARPVGTGLFHLLTDSGVFPSALDYRQGPLPYLAAALLTFAVTRVAAGMTAGAAARIRPIEALAEAAIPPVSVTRIRFLLGCLFAVGTVSLALTTLFMDPVNSSALGGPAVLTGAIAVAILAPAVLRAMITRRVVGAVAWIAGTSGGLAVVNLRTRAVQFAAVLSPIVLATGIGLGNVYSQTTQDEAASEAYADLLAADAVVTSTSGGTSPELFTQLRSMSGVASASELVRSQGWIEEPYDSSHTSDPWPLLGLSAQQGHPIFAGEVASGSLVDLSGDAVALPEGTAADLGVEVGDEIAVRLGEDTKVDVRVVALVEGRDGYESILLPAQLLSAHTTTGLPSQILLRASSSDATGLMRTVEQELERWPGTAIDDRTELTAAFGAGLGVQAWINYLLAIVAIAYAAVASVNTLAVTVLDRRREFGLQRLAGATRRQVSRMLYVEGLLIAAFGLALGAAVSAFTVLPIAVATTGWPVPSGPLWVIPALGVTVLALVLPVTALSARLAMRGRPVDAVTSPAA